MTRKDDKGDQPSGGETTWTNTGATRYGRGQHKTGSFGDDMLRPSPNHGTQRLPNDDDNDDTITTQIIIHSCIACNTQFSLSKFNIIKYKNMLDMTALSSVILINRLLLDRRKVYRRHAPRWLVTWGVVLAVIGYSPEATTPGTGLLLARDTGTVCCHEMDIEHLITSSSLNPYKWCAHTIEMVNSEHVLLIQ